MTRLPLLAVAVSLAVASTAQVPPATSALVGTRLRPGIDTLVTTTGAGERVDTIGWATQSLERVQRPAGLTWLQVYRWHGRDGSESIDSLEMNAQSLRPLREARVTSLGSVTVRYDGVRVHAAVTPAQGDPRALDTTFDAPVFASAGLAVIARALPHAPGYATDIELYYPFPAPLGARRVRLAVTGSELAAGVGGRPADCWVVTAALPSGPTRFWIMKATGELAQFASGEGGAVFRFLRKGA